MAPVTARDRLIGLSVGFVLGFGAAIVAMLALPFILPLSRGSLVSVGQGIVLTGVIWGWQDGAYQLGRLIAWVRRKLSPPRP